MSAPPTAEELSAWARARADTALARAAREAMRLREEVARLKHELAEERRGPNKPRERRLLAALNSLVVAGIPIASSTPMGAAWHHALAVARDVLEEVPAEGERGLPEAVMRWQSDSIARRRVLAELSNHRWLAAEESDLGAAEAFASAVECLEWLRTSDLSALEPGAREARAVAEECVRLLRDDLECRTCPCAPHVAPHSKSCPVAAYERATRVSDHGPDPVTEMAAAEAAHAERTRRAMAEDDAAWAHGVEERPRLHECSSCGGSGLVPGDIAWPCATCDGSGLVPAEARR